jgi:hypothetical protein
MDVGGVGKVQGLSVAHLGKEAVVSVHCYAKEQSYATYLPLFQDLNNTFSFEDGYEFVPAKKSKSAGLLLPVVVFGCVSAPLIVGVLLFTGLRRRTSAAGSDHGDLHDIPFVLPADDEILGRGTGQRTDDSSAFCDKSGSAPYHRP